MDRLSAAGFALVESLPALREMRPAEPRGPRRARIPAAVLVGRTSELGWLGERLEAARRHRGGTVFIVGHAGVGKSRLCRELADAAEGVLCLRGAGSPLLPDSHLGPFVDAVRGHLRNLTSVAVADVLGPLRSAVGGILPELLPEGLEVRRSGPRSMLSDARRSQLEICLRLISRLAERRPLLLILEDVHWVDRGTLELIRYLAPAIRDRAVLLMCTYRSEEVEPAADAPRSSELAEIIHDLLRERVAECLDVSPLDRRATAELVGEFFGIGRPVSADFAATIHRYTGGVPFFVEETIKALVESGTIFEEDGVILRRDLGELALPPPVREIAAARVARLGQQARLLLEVLAVAGRACELGVLARAAGLSRVRAGRAAGEAYRCQFLALASNGRYEFRHELIRRGLLDRMLPDEQAALHGRLAAAVKAEHAADLKDWHAELAERYLLAGQPSKAAKHAWPAAQRAVSLHAYRVALPLLQLGCASGVPGADARAVRELLGDVHARVGDLAEAARVYGDLLDRPPGHEDRACSGRLLLKLAEIAHDQGDSQLALERCHNAVVRLLEGGDQRRLASAYAGLSRYQGALGDWDSSVASAELAVQVGKASGEVAAFCEAANRLAFHLVYAGHADRAEQYALESYARAEAAGELPSLQQACQQLGTIYGDVRAEYRRAGRYYRRSLTLARQCGSVLGEIKALHNLGAWVAKPLGNWRRAEVLLGRACRLAERTGHRRAELYARVHLAELAVLRGDWRQADDRLAAVRALVAQHPDLMIRCRLAAKVEAPLLVRKDQPRDALDRLRKVWEEADAGGFAGELVVLGPPLADLLLDLGRPAEAEAVLARVGSLWPGVRDAAEEVEGRRVVARLHLARGEAESALDVLATASDHAAALERPLDVARIRRDRAVLLASADPTAARDLFRQALGTFTVLGARAEMAATRRLARQHRLMVRIRRPAEKIGDRNTPLTAREAEIADLVAQGETNRGIAARLSLAEGTVEVHIRHIFNKLGLERRAQVATWVTSRQ